MLRVHAPSITTTRGVAVLAILALGLLPLAGASQPITGATTLALKDYNALPGRSSFGDTFTTAWLPGDRLYIGYDDGFSWQGEIDASGQNLALGEVFGQPDDDRSFICHLVNPMSFFGGFNTPMLPDGRTWKQQGMHYADGVLYLSVTGLGTPAQYNSPFGDGVGWEQYTSILKSYDLGRTWINHLGQVNTPPPGDQGAMWPSPRFGNLNFVHYGMAGAAPAVDRAQEFVYLYSVNTDGPGQFLLRVRRGDLANLDRRQFQYYVGGDGMLDASWTSTEANAQPFYFAGLGDIAYDAPLGRYLMIGASALHEAPHPWGPYTRVATIDWDQGGLSGRTHGQPTLPSKFISADGRSIWLFDTGDYLDPSIYHLWYVQVLLQTAPPPPNQPPVARVSLSPASGSAPLTVACDGSASSDPDGAIVAYAWSFGDGASASGATASHAFAAGTYTVTLTVTDDAGASASTTATVTSAASRGPYGGAPRPVPGRIEAEDFDQGGEGVAYHDNDPGNNGGGYRATGVDVRACVDAGGGWQVGWFGAGEWLEYTVDVAATASYAIAARVANGANGGVIHISIDGADRTGPLTFATTGGWDAWTTVTSAAVALGGGSHTVRVTCDAGALDLNWLSFATSGGGGGGGGGGIPTGQWWQLVAKHSGKLLAVAGSSTADGAAVQQWPDDGSSGERWRIDVHADGSCTLTAGCSGKVLDVEGVSTADGARVQQWSDWNGANQRWRVEDTGGGWYRLISVHSGKALDVSGISTGDGAGVQQWTWWGGDNQRWSLVPLPPVGGG